MKCAVSFRDEIDLLYNTALTLSRQLEEADQALSAKNRELAEDRDLMQGVLDAAQVLVVTQNRHGIIQMANKFAAQVTGFSTVKLQGRRFVDLIADVEAHQEVLSKLGDLYARGQRRAHHEHEGDTLPIAVRKHPCYQRLMLITSNVVLWCNDLLHHSESLEALFNKGLVKLR